jgi:hypothetical protein
MLSLNDIKEEEYLFPNDWTEIKCVIKSKTQKIKHSFSK